MVHATTVFAMSEKVSIHSKKFYRVVLESIDPQRENVDSFAIKLAMRTRTSLPRVRQVVRNLPKTVKRGLDVRQANRLKTAIEEVGGRARLETYFLTPGETESASRPSPPRDAQEEPVVELRGMSLDPDLDECIDSGADPDAVELDRSELLDDEPAARPSPKPERPATGTPEVSPQESGHPGLNRAIRDNVLLIAAGILMILLTIAIFKQ